MEPGTQMSREAAMLARPQFIVVFRERSERNVSLLSRIRRVGQAQGVTARAGQAVLAAKGTSPALSKVYERLGVAVTDLTENEVKSLEAQEQVAAVVRNEIRTIPPLRPSSQTEGLESALDTDVGQSLEAATAARLAFLDGMLAAIAAVRAYEGQGSGAVPPAPATSPEVAARARRTWGLAALGMRADYNIATGRGVKLAVLDTGINLRHPDFAGRLQTGITAVSFIPWQSVQDGHGHGTHCAGVAAGPRNTFSGTRYGVASEVDLLVGKVLSNQGSGSDDGILEAIDWAADQGARIISMSLGSPRDPGEGFSQAYETVAQALLNQGIIIVAAAGNESDRPLSPAAVGHPAACPSILAVAAIDRQRRVADFSCRQMDAIGEVNVSAPGVSVYSTWLGQRYTMLDGTSMATPHVAGVAALLLERNPQFSGQELWQAVQTTATVLGAAADFGSGLVQAPTA